MIVAKSGHRHTHTRHCDARTVTLRIKKQYMDAIESGSKRIEYRELTEYYQRLFLEPFNRLKLHYQTSRKLLVEVKSVSIVERGGVDLFALHLGRVLSMRSLKPADRLRVFMTS